MKFVIGLIIALAITITWQTSVLSSEKAASAAARDSVSQVEQENEAAGRVPYTGDCE